MKIEKSDDNYNVIKTNISQYFIKSFMENTCDIVLAEYDGIIVGIGLVFYYDSVPSLYNPTGKNGHITSMFVDEQYRRNGIASQILGKIINIAKEKECGALHLSASEEGKHLYEKFGFNYNRNSMSIKL